MSIQAVEKSTYQSYDSIEPYTMTLRGNFKSGELNLDEIIKHLEVTNLEFKPKTKKKIKVDVLGKPGDIIGSKRKVNGEDIIKGINKGTRAFNNCISNIITVGDGDKPINNIDLKLFKNSIHTTGSKKIEHTIQAWESVKKQLSKMKGVSTVDVNSIEIEKFVYNMINKSFDLGFQIIRDELCLQLHGNYGRNGFYAFWKPGIHSNGVSVKFPLEKFEEFGDLFPKSENEENTDRKKKKKKLPRCVTFIVFATGSVILSGDNDEDMRRAYNLFRETINDIRDKIELKICDV